MPTTVQHDESGHRAARWQILRWILLALAGLGLVLFGFRARTMVAAAAFALGHIAWYAILALPVFCLWTAAASAGWRTLIASSGVRLLPSVGRLWLIRVQAQTVNLVLPLAGAGGEALRAAALRRQTKQGRESAASVASDIVTETAACLIVVILGLGLGWRTVPWSIGTRIGVVVASGGIVLALHLLPQRVIRPGCSLGHGPWAERVRSVCESMLGIPGVGWWRSVGWHLVEKVLNAAEVFIYTSALGFELSPAGAIVATAVMTVIGALGFFMPAQIGASDGGIAFALQCFGVPWQLGIAVALARRLRQILVAVVSLAAFAAVVLWRRRPSRSDGYSPIEGPGTLTL